MADRFTILIARVGKWPAEYLVRDYHSTVEVCKTLEDATAAVARLSVAADIAAYRARKEAEVGR